MVRVLQVLDWFASAVIILEKKNHVLLGPTDLAPNSTVYLGNYSYPAIYWISMKIKKLIMPAYACIG